MQGYFKNKILLAAILSAAILFTAIFLVAIHPTHPNNLNSNSLQQPFNWQQAWGIIDFSGNNKDSGIPSAQLGPKNDIKTIISTDGTQSSNLSTLKVYQLKFSDAASSGYIIDTNGYFPRYQNPNAAVQICTTASGCFVRLYVTEANTNPISTRAVFDEQVLQWNFISAANFKIWSAGTTYQVANANPVFVALRNNNKCYIDEIALNNKQCVKYYQYVGDFTSGRMVDLYNYNRSIAEGDNRPSFPYSSFDLASARQSRCMAAGDSFSNGLAGGNTGSQLSSFAFLYSNGSATAPENATIVTGNSSGPALSAGGITDPQSNSLAYTNSNGSNSNGSATIPNNPIASGGGLGTNHELAAVGSTDSQSNSFAYNYSYGNATAPEVTIAMGDRVGNEPASGGTTNAQSNSLTYTSSNGSSASSGGSNSSGIAPPPKNTIATGGNGSNHEPASGGNTNSQPNSPTSSNGTGGSTTNNGNTQPPNNTIATGGDSSSHDPTSSGSANSQPNSPPPNNGSGSTTTPDNTIASGGNGSSNGSTSSGGSNSQSSSLNYANNSGSTTGGTVQGYTNNLGSSNQLQLFNWQQAWGSIDFSGNNKDGGIPCTQLGPKNDIKTIVSKDGIQSSDLSSLKVYKFDFSDSGKPGYIIDGNGYFPQYQNPNASLQICSTADGCYVSLYVAGPETDLISTPASGTPACPATPEANTSCVSSCAATVQNCPNHFQYNTRVVFDDQILQWSFMSATDFQTWSAGANYQLANANPVFVALRNNNKCYNDEIALNNNQCVKYYQYVGDFAAGTMVDLYNYNGSNADGDYRSRFTYSSFDLAAAHKARGIVMGDGFGHELAAGGSIDLQLDSFTFINGNGSTTPPENTAFGFPGTNGIPAKPNFASFHIENHSSNNYFVPIKTNLEFCSFMNSNQPGVTITPEKLQFTQWVGDLTCPAKLNAPVTIAAQRFCQSSTSDYRPCQACIDAKVPGWEQGCSTTQQCNTNACVINAAVGSNVADYAAAYFGASPALVSEFKALIKKFDGKTTSSGECLADQGLWTPDVGRKIIDYVALGNGYDACEPAWVADFCDGGGHWCLAAETMVALPDGASKRLDQIKAGDMVLGFKDSKDPLIAFKVKTLAITPNQTLLNINGELKLTPNHKVFTSKGAKIQASKLKVGTVLLRGDGTEMVVKTIEKVPAKATVYNLKLEDAHAGFVADGVRVVGYDK